MGLTKVLAMDAAAAGVVEQLRARGFVEKRGVTMTSLPAQGAEDASALAKLLSDVARLVLILGPGWQESAGAAFESVSAAVGHGIRVYVVVPPLLGGADERERAIAGLRRLRQRADVVHSLPRIRVGARPRWWEEAEDPTEAFQDALTGFLRPMMEPAPAYPAVLTA